MTRLGHVYVAIMSPFKMNNLIKCITLYTGKAVIPKNQSSDRESKGFVDCQTQSARSCCYGNT